MIQLIGTIGVEATAQLVRAGLDESQDVVELYIDSPGGDVIESNAISLAISEYAIAHPEKQYTCTLGSLCASAAANIVVKLPSCFTVKAYKDTLVMFHSCSGVFEGNPEQLKDYSIMMTIVNEAVIRELISKTSLDASEVKSAFSAGRELWMDGRKAKEVGFVDELIDAEPEQIAFTASASTKKVLELVAEYKHKHLEVKMEEEKEVTAKAEETPESTPEVKAETEVEVKAETEVEKEEVAEEVEKEKNEEPEIDWESECTTLRQECDDLKKEVEALKALVAKYTPTAKPTASKTTKADWLTMVRELNAKHLPEREYAKEYAKLKLDHKPEFEAFMENHKVR